MDLNLQTGDIIMYKGTTFFPRLVSYFTRSPYTHCSMVLYPGYLIEADWYKRSNIIRFKDFEPKSMEIYRLKGGLTQQQQYKMLIESTNELGKFYDYPQLMEYVYEFFAKVRFYDSELNSKNLLICSELIDDIYTNIGIDLISDRAEGNVTPADLPTSYLLERIY